MAEVRYGIDLDGTQLRELTAAITTLRQQAGDFPLYSDAADTQ